MQKNTATLTSTEPELQVLGPLAHIRLRAPRRHNALSITDIAVFSDHLGQVGADGGIRCLVVSAAGKSFCSGHDLSHFDLEQAAAVPPPVEFERLANSLEAMPVPTVCALQGSVYAGGIDLALACDFRIGVTGMVAGMPAARIGIHLYPGALRRYAARLSAGAAKRLCLAAATLPADELLRLGFLDALVDPAALDQAVTTLAEALVANAPIAVQGMKRALDAFAQGDVQEGEALAQRNFERSFRSADLLEGLRAMREKRKPAFVGR